MQLDGWMQQPAPVFVRSLLFYKNQVFVPLCLRIGWDGIQKRLAVGRGLFVCLLNEPPPSSIGMLCCCSMTSLLGVKVAHREDM